LRWCGCFNRSSLDNPSRSKQSTRVQVYAKVVDAYIFIWVVWEWEILHVLHSSNLLQVRSANIDELLHVYSILISVFQSRCRMGISSSVFRKGWLRGRRHRFYNYMFADDYSFLVHCRAWKIRGCGLFIYVFTYDIRMVGLSKINEFDGEFSTCHDVSGFKIEMYNFVLLQIA
jgi:hypothetical protein